MFCMFTPNIASFQWHSYGLSRSLLALIRTTWHAHYLPFEFTFLCLWNIPNEVNFRAHSVSLSPRAWERIRVLTNGKISSLNLSSWGPLGGSKGGATKRNQASFLRKSLDRSFIHRTPLHLEISRSLKIRGSWKPQRSWFPTKQKPYTSPDLVWTRRSNKGGNAAYLEL